MKNDNKIFAVLGPTNTGKTFFAVERMLDYKTGIIGFPLRLLAREIFDKLVLRRGKENIALITGEERIVPHNPSYWICTVEAMPKDLGVEFVAIDEIQLCADYERGHIFTDKLLYARGTKETMFLGSDAMSSKIESLFPKIEILGRKRFSKLTYVGKSKISRIPPRSAIVTFSIDEVYGIAELIRRQKGGAAVIMGALSPRTRNAQVDLYQNGDVDYLIATDAIGMGLNLDIKNIYFAKLSKFDGRRERLLYLNELAQIAGRAGRFKTDGCFGVTGDVDNLENLKFQAIEKNRFTPIKSLQWRNSKLVFTSVNSLIRSLELQPVQNDFHRAPEGLDLTVLKRFLNSFSSKEIPTYDDLKLLWSVCQVPDFRKISLTDHFNLMNKLFGFLKSGGVIPDDWLLDQVKRLDRVDGDIDILSKRLAFIRTWTYVAYKKSWTDDNQNWENETKRIEERLSDALHEMLKKRFIDQRTSVLVRGLKQRERLVPKINHENEVFVNDQLIGKLVGLRFEMDYSKSSEEAKALKSTAMAVLGPQYLMRSEKLYNSSDQDFSLSEKGKILWLGANVGVLSKGKDMMSPKVVPIVDEEAGAAIKEKVTRRLEHLIDRRVESIFEPLLKLKADEELKGLARGLAFRITESLGIIPRCEVASDVKNIEQKERATLRKYGIRFGQFTIFHFLMLKPAATGFRLVLWGLFSDKADFFEPPPPGLVTIPVSPKFPHEYYNMAGYKVLGLRAIRVDILERLSDILRTENIWKGFEANVDMLSLTGLTLDQFADLMSNIGYKVTSGTRKRKDSYKRQNEEDPLPQDINALEKKNSKINLEKRTKLAEKDFKLEFDDQKTTVLNDKFDDEETFYVFKFLKKNSGRVDSSTTVEKQNERKIFTRVSETNEKRPLVKKRKKRLSEKKNNFKKAISKGRQFDPDNPFAALMELKNKL